MTPLVAPGSKLERVSRTGKHTPHVARTLIWLRKHGFLCQKVEYRPMIIRPGMPRWGHAPMGIMGPSRDLWGVGDVVAIPPPYYTGRKGAWILQICAKGGASGHRRKAAGMIVDGIPVLERIEAGNCRFLLVKYVQGRTVPKKAGKTGRLLWVREIEESLGDTFVNWLPTDFALMEAFVVPKAETDHESGEESEEPALSQVLRGRRRRSRAGADRPVIPPEESSLPGDPAL